MTSPNQEHLTPAHALGDCLVCRKPHIRATMELVKSPCGCDVLMCERCQRAPMTSEWIKWFAAAHHKSCQPDPMFELSA